MSTQIRRASIVLFSDDQSIDGHRVRLVLAEKDIPAAVELVDPDDKPEDLIHLNPYNSLPTLIDRELVLYGSRVIIAYLDERYPHPPFMPIDPISRARTRLALYRIEQDWYSVLPAITSGSGAVRLGAIQTLRDSLVASVDVFAAKPFFLSDDYSLLDATLAPMLWRLRWLGVELPVGARIIEKYAERIFARRGFQRSLTETERLLY